MMTVRGVLFVVVAAVVMMMTATASDHEMDLNQLIGLRPDDAEFLRFVGDIKLHRGVLESVPIAEDGPDILRKLAGTIRVLLDQADGVVPFGNYPLRYAFVLWRKIFSNPDLKAFADAFDEKFGARMRSGLFQERGEKFNYYVDFVDNVVVQRMEGVLGLSGSSTLLLIAVRIMTAAPEPTSNFRLTHWLYLAKAKRLWNGLNAVQAVPDQERPAPWLPRPVEALFNAHRHLYDLYLWSSDTIPPRRRKYQEVVLGSTVQALLGWAPDMAEIVSSLQTIDEYLAPMNEESSMLFSLFRDGIKPVFGEPLRRDQRALEYQRVQTETPFLPADANPEQRRRCRYSDLSAGPSRVVLKPEERDSNNCNDFINADSVPGLAGTDFIATQAPIQDTFGDFWKMIWQQNTNIIVMLANHLTEGPTKVNQYWPEGASVMQFDNGYQVQLVQTETESDFVVRTFELLKSQDPGFAARTVTQIQYTKWPDHGVPELPSFGRMYDMFEALRAKSESAGPVVVHCSAGVGRTGAFIAIDMAVSAYTKARQTRSAAEAVRIFDVVKHIRKHRNGSIQAEGQYEFVYRAVMDRLFGRIMF